MKVLDLQCRLGHVFEGWFASEDDYLGQKQRGLLQCPLCADDHIEKRLSAPRLNLGSRDVTEPAKAPVPSSAPAPTVADTKAESMALQAAWLSLARKIVAHTEDVGHHFAQEARRMHHGEVPERGIRGHATPDETVQLLEEGIAVLPLPLPEAAKETLQ
ncbi:DUF1178 family protein [Acidovorax radicis]|jgi:hypothetical protein|uniref:DUF1178 family protein n=1 Tax=Acidovorax radicis TaxID=758826 RepID=UPI001CFB3A85|nr:DUF1178 family protein [Acidovorax radicis]UCV00632.1 DUF1178 family protein [Acidovorax radicis]